MLITASIKRCKILPETCAVIPTVSSLSSLALLQYPKHHKNLLVLFCLKIVNSLYDCTAAYELENYMSV